MADTKYVCIIVDDFSSRALTFPNVSLYDYSVSTSYTNLDTYIYDYTLPYPHGPIGYGDVDYTQTNYQQFGYFNANDLFDLTLSDYGSLLPNYNFLSEEHTDYYTYQENVPYMSSPETVPGHGDWVLEAFFQQLDDENSVEIVAVDIDFTSFDDFYFLFDPTSNLIEDIYYDAVSRVYDPENSYLLGVFNASWGGYAPPPNAIDEFINTANGFVVQASANVTQNGISWSASINNVINVGAWNIDQDGHSLASDTAALQYNDIYANGYVNHQSWGWNFGTSFAAPKVSAELINFYDSIVSPALEKGLIEPDPDQTLSEAEMTSVTNWTVAALSTEMEVFVEELGSYYGPLNVLSDDVIGGAPPTEVPLSVSDLSFSVSSSRNFVLGLTELTLDDVFGLSEFETTGLSDSIYGFSNAVFFGGSGDDVFFSRVNGSSQIFIGGSGADTYNINTVGMMIIIDAGADDGAARDKVVASGIGLSSNTSYLATIDGRHLYGYDELTQQHVIIIDGYEASGSKIELIELSDGVFTYQDIVSYAPNSPNFLGDLSWEDALAYPTNMMNNEIDYYKTYAQMDQEILDTETIFHVDAYGILGKVIGRSGGRLSDVKIRGDIASSDLDLASTSSDQGSFILIVEDGIDLTVIGGLEHFNERPNKAITAQDALDALRLAVGLATTSGSKDAFAYIAADFNQDGRVSAQDALEILKYSVGFRDLDAEWKFIDADADYSGISRSNTVHQDGVSVEAMSVNLEITMTGILLGDVNDTYTTYLDML